MDKAAIAAEIEAFLEAEFPHQGLELTPSTDLLGEWFMDSLGITETVIFLESRFGIDVGRADITGINFKDIAALSEFVAQRLAG